MIFSLFTALKKHLLTDKKDIFWYFLKKIYFPCKYWKREHWSPIIVDLLRLAAFVQPPTRRWIKRHTQMWQRIHEGWAQKAAWNVRHSTVWTHRNKNIYYATTSKQEKQTKNYIWVIWNRFRKYQKTKINGSIRESKNPTQL